MGKPWTEAEHKKFMELYTTRSENHTSADLGCEQFFGPISERLKKSGFDRSWIACEHRSRLFKKANAAGESTQALVFAPSMPQISPPRTKRKRTFIARDGFVDSSIIGYDEEYHGSQHAKKSRAVSGSSPDLCSASSLPQRPIAQTSNSVASESNGGHRGTGGGGGGDDHSDRDEPTQPAGTCSTYTSFDRMIAVELQKTEENLTEIKRKGVAVAEELSGLDDQLAAVEELVELRKAKQGEAIALKKKLDADEQKRGALLNLMHVLKNTDSAEA